MIMNALTQKSMEGIDLPIGGDINIVLNGEFKKGNAPIPTLISFLTQIDISPHEVFQNDIPLT